jgi:hypothetical protein
MMALRLVLPTRKESTMTTNTGIVCRLLTSDLLHDRENHETVQNNDNQPGAEMLVSDEELCSSI